jgi:DNA-binding transcriptional ArsR family regulator
MSDDSSATQPSAPVAGPPASAGTVKPAKTIHPAKAFAALGNPLRWEILKMLAEGRGLSASQVAARVKRDFDGVSKHLRLMREAGVLTSMRGEDRRLELYHIPESILRADGVVDLGFCAIRLPKL